MNALKKNNTILTSINNVITHQLKRFFAKRAPRQDSVQLNMRNVYIFFSLEGILFASLLVITFITGINYANNLVLGLCFYLISILLIALHITFSHISGLKVRLLDITTVEEGKPAWATIEVHNAKGQACRQLNFVFDHSEYVTNHLATIDVTNKAHNKDATSENNVQITEELLKKKITQKIVSLTDRQTIRLPIMTDKRGRLQLPRLIISTIYPLGVMRAWSYVYFSSPAWVYPKAEKFDWSASHTIENEEETIHSHLLTVGQTDFDRLEEYQEGESLARVSWAHIARGHGMLTKHFADNVSQELKLNYSDMPALNHEHKLRQLAFALHKIEDENQPFLLNLPDDIGKIGQGKRFMQNCLLRLAKLP